MGRTFRLFVERQSNQGQNVDPEGREQTGVTQKFPRKGGSFPKVLQLVWSSGQRIQFKIALLWHKPEEWECKKDSLTQEIIHRPYL